MNFLKKLFAKKASELADVPPEFLQENAPDWLIDLKGNEMPNGNTFSLRVQLYQSLRTGFAEILVLPREPGGQPTTASADLDRIDLDRILVILGFSFPGEIASIHADAADGLPVTVSVYRRHPFAFCLADCNLAAWLGSKQPAPAVVEIGRILLQIKARAL